MGNSDFFKAGEFNFYCDLCGKKAKSGTAMKTWDNHYVCRSHKEVRNPQDFLRGVTEGMSLPWSRSNSGVPATGTPIGITFTVPLTRGAVTDEITFVDATGGALNFENP